MSLIKFLNPYYYVGAAVILASLVGTFYYQTRQIHHYHQLFDSEHDNFTKEHTIVVNMLLKQAEQTSVTDKNVLKVVTVPEKTQTLVKEVQMVPIPQDCTAPVYSQEVYNAF